jgi:co-chaperonin GroES (HSP10)
VLDQNSAPMTHAQFNGGKMHFLPFNRHLVVDIVEETKKQDESLIVLPSDYEKPQSPYVKALVIEVSKDSKFYRNLEVNDTLLVERRMLHKIEIDGSTFYLILENYILGRIDT